MARNVSKSTSRSNCALCLQPKRLMKSHIVPSFVGKYLKDTSATGYLRGAIERNLRRQDLMTEPLFCQQCEQVIGRVENKFRQLAFDVVQDDDFRELRYGPWLLSFAVSLSFRVLVCMRDDWERDFPQCKDKVDRIIEDWRLFLLGERKKPGGEHHLFICAGFPRSLPKDSHPKTLYYLFRSIDCTPVVNSTRLVGVYCKLLRSFFFSPFYPSDARGWKNTRIHAGEGTSGFHAQTMPKTPALNRKLDLPPPHLVSILVSASCIFDSPSRDSLAADLMEAVRPEVDAFLLDWITRELLSRKWFFEQGDGNCRLMGPFAIRLSETAPTWGRAVAPFAEWITRTLWSRIRKSAREPAPSTPLTQGHRREAKGALPVPPPERMPRRENICRDCGTSINDGSIHCPKCVLPYAKQHLVDAASAGRLAAHTAEAEASRSATQREHFRARRSWKPSDQPAWLNAEAYAKEIQPRLLGLTNSAIIEALGVTKYYAIQIRHGRRRPHPRHWQALAKLAAVS